MATAKKKSKAKKKAKTKKAPATKKVAKKKVAKKQLAKKTAAKKKVTKKAAKKKTAKKAVAKKAKAAVKKAKKAVKKAVKKITTATKTPKVKTPAVKWDSFFTPLDDRIVVVVEAPSEKTAGGLYIPATVTSEKPNQGQILAVGRGKKDKKGRIRPMDVKAGETVLFGSYAGMKMILNNQEVLMLREEDILGVMN